MFTKPNERTIAMQRLNRKNMNGLALAGLLVITAFTSLGAASGSSSAPQVSRAYLHSYNLPSSGLALEGYCPVAYQVVGEPVRGSSEYASNYKGVTYHLVSKEAKEVFEADPEKYVPAYGGWCAFGMAIEDKFPVDPTAFKVVDGRLMLFLRNENVDALALWNQNDEREQVVQADSFWTHVKQ